MKYYQNLHTHTVYCDGKDTPEELVLAAIAEGFDSIGFSAHAPMTYSSYPLSEERTAACFAEVTRLKELYRDRIDIRLGIEADLYITADLFAYEYVIGTVHYILKDGVYLALDRSKELFSKLLHESFGDDGMALAKAYYRCVSELPDRIRTDIVGHFDLVTKWCEYIPYLDLDSEEYLDLAREAIDSLVSRVPVFEVNTGAISRGYRTAPYPSLSVLREMKKAGVHLVLSSDCHDKRHLSTGFDQALALIRAAGFRELYRLTDKGFVASPLD